MSAESSVGGATGCLRLADLQKYGDFAADAKRKIDEAETDSVFQPFRKQANEAINR